MSLVRGDRSRKLRFSVSGDDELREAIQGLKAGVQNRVFKAALRKLASIANKRAKGKVRSRTGLLKRSIGIKYRAYRATGGFAFVIGPRKNVVGHDAEGLKAWPLKYAHLVERGRQAVRPKKARMMVRGNAPFATWYGRFAKAVPADPFMKPAYDYIASRSTSFLRSEVTRGVASEAAKYAKRGKSIRVGGG